MKKNLYLTLFLVFFISSSAWAQDKLNVIIMLVDNLGWGELGVYGKREDF